VAPAVVTVALPTYAKLQHNPEKLSQAFGMVLFFLARVLMPFVLIFAVLPESFIRMIGPQWVSAVPVLRILSIGALLAPISENMKQLLYAVGKPENIVRIRIMQLILFLPLMYVLISTFGISGAASGIVLNYFIGVIGSYFAIRRFVTVEWLRMLPAVPFRGRLRRDFPPFPRRENFLECLFSILLRNDLCWRCFSHPRTRVRMETDEEALFVHQTNSCFSL
jgi:O-antigen/teichoic acid export membrane protein